MLPLFSGPNAIPSPGISNRLGSGPGLDPFLTEQAQHPLLDRLGPYPVDEWVEHGRDQQVEVSSQDVEMCRDPLSPALTVEGEEPRRVEGQDDTDVGATSAIGLQTSLSGGEAYDLPQDQHIGDSDEDGV